MRLLLDTNVPIAWMVDGRLSTQARVAIADPSSDALLSVIALWELANTDRRQAQYGIATIAA